MAFNCQCRNSYSFNRIFISLEGRGGSVKNHSGGGTVSPLIPGEILFMPCGVDLEFDFHDTLRFIALHFNLELFGGYDVFTNIIECARKKDKLNAGKSLENIFLNSNGISAAAEAKGIIYQIAASFIQDKALYKFEQMDEKYGKLFEFIKKKADAQTSIEDLATVSGITRDKLSRSFPKDCGLTLKDYLSKQLIGKAERLLLAGHSARHVSEQLNFTSEYYFARFFKKHTSQTSGQFKKEAMPSISGRLS